MVKAPPQTIQPVSKPKFRVTVEAQKSPIKKPIVETSKPKLAPKVERAPAAPKQNKTD